MKRSPCCDARVSASLGDGVLIGSCGECGVAVVRRNPYTGKEETLAPGDSPWAPFTGAPKPGECG